MATYNASQDGESISQQSTGGTYISNQITSYPTLAATEKVLKPVINELGLDETVDDLAGQITVTNPTNTAFVNIAAVDGDPKQAADIANAVAESLKTVIENDLYTGDTSPVKVSIVQKAQTPLTKSSPKTVLYLAVGVVLGLIVGVFAALIKDLLNTRVEEPSDVRGVVRASSLGSVPVDDSLESKRPVLVSQPNGAIAEEFRRIHTNIDFLQTDRTEGVGQLLVITSAQPSEGKTTMAINTAVALAEDGAKVLLIDADLRHPSVAHHLGIEGAAGLAHVLSGQMGPKDVVQSYWKTNPAHSAWRQEAGERWRTIELRNHEAHGGAGAHPIRLRDHRYRPVDGVQRWRGIRPLGKRPSAGGQPQRVREEVPAGGGRRARHRAGAGAWLHLQSCRSEEGQLPLQLLLLL